VSARKDDTLQYQSPIGQSLLNRWHGCDERSRQPTESPATSMENITMMSRDIPKLCADSLRAFANDNYDIKLKPAHAHELVAAYLGYRSKNALLADNKYPIGDLAKAEIVSMIPDDVVDQRRKELQGLSIDLPDSYTLGEAVYGPLFSDEWWGSTYPPFRGFDKLAKVLVEKNDAFRTAFSLFGEFPMDHFVVVRDGEDSVILDVIHSYKSTSDERRGDGKTTIKLPRVAARIGFGAPNITVGQWTGGARRTLKSLGVRL
jgi:hypothetical protein